MTSKSDVGLQAVAETTGKFCNDFLKVATNEKSGNLIASPLSAQILLAMGAYGANGNTAAQMRSALYIPNDDSFGQSGYQSLIENLNALKEIDLRLANKIFTSNSVAVKPTYKELIATKFLSSSQEVNFGDAKGSAKIINTWCEEQTNNRIKDLISPDDVSNDTALVMVNAVYFKGQWKRKFNPVMTQDRPFHVTETNIIDVPTMFMEKDLRHGNLMELNARFLEIPYQGEDISMIIILPNEITGLQTVKDNLHKIDLGKSLQQSHIRPVELYLPKFKIESTLDLKETLEKMGMTEMFQNNANFSGIADDPMKVSKVIQKAFIEVNEEGTEAGVATGSKFMLLCMRHNEVFNFNHPFYYQIRSTTLDTPLFAGFYTAQV